MDVGTAAGRRSRAEHLGPDRRRPQVLDAALEIALESGLGAVSFGAVAERLKVTRPVVYACFADRVQLIDALLAREEEVLLRESLAALPRGQVEGGEAVFVQGFRAFLATVARRPESWRILFESDPDPAVVDLARRSRLVLAEGVERTLRPTLVHWGTTDLARKLPVIVEFFVSSCEGAMRSLLHEGNAWTVDELGEFVGKAVYRALREA